MARLTGSILPLLLLLHPVLLHAQSPPAGIKPTEFPPNENLEARNVSLEVTGFVFTSGLRHDEREQPTCQGLDIETAQWWASGFIVGSDGTVLTNYHVAMHARRADAIFNDGARYEIKQIKGYDSAHDLAALKISGNREFPAVKLGNSDSVQVRDKVMAVGNPRAMGLNVTEGSVSRVVSDDNGVRQLITHTATITHGNSGGALYRGDSVIGVNAAGLPGEGFNFAVPINFARPLLGPGASQAVPLEAVFAPDPERIARSAHELTAINGQTRPGAPACLPVMLEGLQDYLVMLVAPEEADLDLMAFDVDKQLRGCSMTQGNRESLLISGESKGSLYLCVFDSRDRAQDSSKRRRQKHADEPTPFGLTIYAVVW